MGSIFSSGSSKKQILLVGLEGSGKTTFMCLNFLNYTSEEFKTEPTLGNNKFYYNE